MARLDDIDIDIRNAVLRANATDREEIARILNYLYRLSGKLKWWQTKLDRGNLTEEERKAYEGLFAEAKASAAGQMSAADKAKLIGMPGYNLIPGCAAETTGSVGSSGAFKGITVGSFLTGLVGVPVAVSFDAKGNAGDVLRVYAYQSSGLSIDTYQQTPEMFTLAADWQRFSFTAHVKQWAGVLNDGMVAFWIQGGTVAFKLRKIKIETGTSATVWTPNAEDIALN